ncbi:MAG: hypothetical protein A2074_05960 [Candidatus Aquicultor primus]|uniref:F420-non-reducing hydrogenase iron-sulfur subunit D domain-containing protein n=1 Tax=Candidatus Aquicultor primus TaxID=1797195 RepID=A0A1F2UP67_9ACTN|nr:MAG: hypothetical protein A2074_05960 [Candidatus Aquicultor primus]
MALFNEILPVLGIEPERFRYTWIAASEGKELKEEVEDFIVALQKVGKFNPDVFSMLAPDMVAEIENAGEKVEA